ncbi:MAG: hypothetical protein J5J00_01550, partial [Deltaproteobacteria bacterium]|nr:hypothetical protein [Deltaproteobacteria bacterium]
MDFDSMSYAEFKKEFDQEFASLGGEAGCGPNLDPLRTKIERATMLVFRRWMDNERFVELVDWYIQNFDSGGGEQYLIELSEALKIQANQEALQKLFRSAINSRERS